MVQSNTDGKRTYTLQLMHVEGSDLPRYETIVARSITAAIALLYENYSEYSNKYRVVRAEEIFIAE